MYFALNTAEFKSYGRDEIFDKYVKENVSNSNFSNFDEINSFFSKNRREGIDVVNNVLLDFAQRMEIEFLNRYSLVCNDSSNVCNGVTPSGEKAYVDGSHLSLAGAKYFGAKLAERKCLYKTNFVPNDFSITTKDSDFNIEGIKEAKILEMKELYEVKLKMEEELKNKNLTPAQRRQLKKKQKQKLKQL